MSFVVNVGAKFEEKIIFFFSVIVIEINDNLISYIA